MATVEGSDLLAAHRAKDVLRFIACGSVDDGKSTLIGRLLYDAGALLEDQLETLAGDSRHSGSRDGDLDLSLALDGLAAEREQGITIDVAYRYFATEHRKFIVADTPGHEQYTRNMVTGASTADAAVILVDARHGVTAQTRRHTHLMALLGIGSVVLAVNKLDLLDFDRSAYDRIVAEYDAVAAPLGFEVLSEIPVSARDGDNVTAHSGRTPWYDGPTLLEWLHAAPPHHRGADGPFRMPVQWVNRPDPEFRGVSGQVVGGTVRVGDRVRVEPSGITTSVARIVTFDGDRDLAVTDESVTLVLADDVDATRGDVVCCGIDPTEAADELDVELVWMGDAPLEPGRPYTLRVGTQSVGARLATPTAELDVTTGEHRPTTALTTNGIASLQVSLDRPVAFDRYVDNPDTGGLIVTDRTTHQTVAAGMITEGRRRSAAIRWQDLDVDKDAHARLNGHRPRVVWMTGLSGAGKTTIADLVQQRLHADGVRTAVLDGDNVRHGLSRDLGFSDADRVENNRRVAEVARLMCESGLVVIVSFISPFRADRDAARAMFADDEFVEVFVDAPLEVAEARDPKGLYRRARAGELPGFTGIDAPYEAPECPDVHLDATGDAAGAAERVVAHLLATGLRAVDGR